MFNPRAIYTFVLYLLLPYVFFHLLWRGRRQPEYFRHIAERFGIFSIQPDKPIIWLHTVSVGETRAAASLIQRLSQTYPSHTLLLTHTTPTGRAAGEQLYGDKVIRVYLPYDYPFAVDRFLRHFKPCVGILLETEIWFNLIHACKCQQIPLLLLNARLSERSARRYAYFPKLTHMGLGELRGIAAQTEADAQRLSTLGGEHVSVMGNLKFDIEAPAAQLELGLQLRMIFGANRKILLAASTRDGEELLLLEALRHSKLDNLLLVIVPRHPQRFNDVEKIISHAGFIQQKRSDNAPIHADTQVVLGDSMGEMFAYYAACDVAFIGGSLLPFGGQNLIEACALGKPVLIGPHTYNFEQASELAIASGGALRIENANAITPALEKLFSDWEYMHAMSTAGLRFVQENQGATSRALTQVNAVISTS